MTTLMDCASHPNADISGYFNDASPRLHTSREISANVEEENESQYDVEGTTAALSIDTHHVASMPVSYSETTTKNNHKKRTRVRGPESSSSLNLPIPSSDHKQGMDECTDPINCGIAHCHHDGPGDIVATAPIVSAPCTGCSHPQHPLVPLPLQTYCKKHKTKFFADTGFLSHLCEDILSSDLRPSSIDYITFPIWKLQLTCLNQQILTRLEIQSRRMLELTLASNRGKINAIAGTSVSTAHFELFKSTLLQFIQFIDGYATLLGKQQHGLDETGLFAVNTISIPFSVKTYRRFLLHLVQSCTAMDNHLGFKDDIVYIICHYYGAQSVLATRLIADIANQNRVPVRPLLSSVLGI